MKQFNPKPCKLCGQMFTPKSANNSICDKDHYAICPVCNNKFIWNSTAATPACSKACKKIQTKQKCLDKYGVEHPMQCKQVQQNHRNSIKAKYGVESPLQSEEIKNRAIQTNMNKFGTCWALSNKEVRAKIESTNIKRYNAKSPLSNSEVRAKSVKTWTDKYGVDNPFKSDEIQSKIKCTLIDTYGADSAMKNPDVYNKLKNTRISNNGQYFTESMLKKAKDTWMAKYGVDNPAKSEEILNKIKATMIERYGQQYGLLLSNAGKSSISSKNLEIKSKLEERGIECELEFALDSYRYDIAIPKQKILIEVDPTYTHNAVGNHWNPEGLDKWYHMNKTEAARNNGYRCIHIFDWEDVDKILELVYDRRSVYARNCKMYKLNMDVANKFIDANHLQGRVRNQSIALGLASEGELLQVMTFGKPRYDSSYDYELLRLCSKSGVTVVGGAQKLFNFAIKYLEYDNIISYCDISKFNGDIYTKLGMKLVRTSPPQEIWSKGDKKITANLLRQRGFDQLFGTNYGKNTSNELLMLENGWLPVYDCGQAVYAYRKAAQN